MTHSPTRFRLARAGLQIGTACAVAMAALVLVPSPAQAHADPTLFTVLTDVRPSLPPEVKFTIGNDGDARILLFLTDPTATPVSVLGEDGKPFLQVSADGVYGDITSPFLRAPAPLYKKLTASHWDRLSDRAEWAWADPRLDAPTLPEAGLPGGANTAGVDLASRKTQVVGTWKIGLRYGDKGGSLSGATERRPFLGQITTSVTGFPAGVMARILEGPSPALNLEVSPGTELDVIGGDGVVFLRMLPQGSRIRADSTEYRLTQTAMKLPAEEAGKRWLPLGSPTAVTWVDPRLRPSLPDAAALESIKPVEIGTWNVPVTVGGVRTELTGAHTWVPLLRKSTASQSWPFSGPVTAGMGLLGGGAFLFAAGAVFGRRPSATPTETATLQSVASSRSGGDSR